MGNIEKEEFRKVMGSFASGVTIVTTVAEDGTMTGLTATAFSSVSLDPPLCLVCVDTRGSSHDALLANRKFAVNMLAADQMDLSNRFASRSDDKFAGVAYEPGVETGCPLLAGALATMECTVVDVFPGGDHAIVIGELRSTKTNEGRPLLYFRGGYRALSES